MTLDKTVVWEIIIFNIDSRYNTITVMNSLKSLKLYCNKTLLDVISSFYSQI